MGVGLQPLEFSECLADSPAFRENLLRHEKELERTSHQIKRLIKEVKDVVHAAKRLGAAQLALASSMEQFEFTCIGASMTEDERVISRSLRHFAALMRTIEDERERMLGRANEQIIEPLEKFRKEHIGAVKESKKKFDKKTAKFCQSQERTLALSTKKPEPVFQEADAALEMAERDLTQASLSYVCELQAVRAREQFELVETLLGFVFGWWTFHHTAHDVHHDAEPAVRDLQLRIQRTRTNFEETSKQTESLMKKIMEMRQMNKEEETRGEAAEGVARSGYLFLMEKKAFGTTWTKHYCTYDAASRTLTLTPYNQINVKASPGTSEAVAVAAARAAPDGDECERRHCMELTPAGGGGGGGGAAAASGAGGGAALTLQARSAADRAAWLRAIQNASVQALPAAEGAAGFELDDCGFEFVRRLIAELERRELSDQGLYRVGGVASKVSRLVATARAWGTLPEARELRDAARWETRTLTSALKGYLRALREPLLTWRLRGEFVAAAKCETLEGRVSRLARLVAQLPGPRRALLTLLVQHLCRVAAARSRNLMGVSNLAVCFGPTLLRAPRETVAAILDIKFCNVAVETMLAHADRLFPPETDTESRAPMPAMMNSASSRNDVRDADWAERYGAPHHALASQLQPRAAPPPRRAAAARSSSSSAESLSSASPPPRQPVRYTRVRTLYACLGESAGELSFEPNQVVTDVRESGEPGWLRGTLRGLTGLLPSNYVEPLP